MKVVKKLPMWKAASGKLDTNLVSAHVLSRPWHIDTVYRESTRTNCQFRVLQNVPEGGGLAKWTRQSGRDGKDSNNLTSKSVRVYKYLLTLYVLCVCVCMYVCAFCFFEAEKGLEKWMRRRMSRFLMQSSALHLPRCIDAIYESQLCSVQQTQPTDFSTTSWTFKREGSKLALTPHWLFSSERIWEAFTFRSSRLFEISSINQNQTVYERQSSVSSVGPPGNDIWLQYFCLPAGWQRFSRKTPETFQCQWSRKNYFWRFTLMK